MGSHKESARIMSDEFSVDGFQNIDRDESFMRQALDAAQKAYDLGEVPVGAVLVHENRIIATGYNHPIGLHDPSAHAEMQALRAGAQLLQNYRMPECELYVTLEPCLMCAGAIFHARLKRVVFGASDYKTGVAGSIMNAFENEQINHHTTVIGGVLEDETREILQRFFRERRTRQKNQPTDDAANP